MGISEKELKYLLNFERIAKSIHYNYIYVGLLLFLAIYEIIRFLKLRNEADFYKILLSSTLGLLIFLFSRSFEKHYKIFIKMKNYIVDLEKRIPVEKSFFD